MKRRFELTATTHVLTLTIGGFALLSLMTASLQAADSGQRVTTENGVFSYVIPNDWEIQHLERLKYPKVFAPLSKGKDFRTNINVMEEAYTGTLDDYLDIAVPAVQKLYPKAKEIERGDFKTTSGEMAKRVVMDNPLPDFTLRQSLYVFSHRGMIYVFCFTTLKEEAETFTPLSERIARTFRFEE